jgi:uncharacterized lipoprotein YbaY
VTDPIEQRTVEVTLVLPTGLAPSAAAVLRVRLEDVSVADRPSAVVSSAEVPVPEPTGGGAVEVSLAVPAARIDERDSYSVFAHLDLDGSGDVSVGDALTTQTYPVLTRGAPDRVEVTLTRI